MIFFNFKRNTVKLYIAILASLVFGIISPSLSTAGSSQGVLLRVKLKKESGRKIGTYRTIIIGINDYRDSKIPDIKTPVNDTKALANILKIRLWF